MDERHAQLICYGCNGGCLGLVVGFTIRPVTNDRLETLCRRIANIIGRELGRNRKARRDLFDCHVLFLSERTLCFSAPTAGREAERQIHRARPNEAGEQECGRYNPGKKGDGARKTTH